MNNKRLFTTLAGIFVITLVIVISSLYKRSKENSAATGIITNFEECVAAGNPVMESYPRQCSARGLTFSENIGNAVEKADLIKVDKPRPNQEVTSPLTVTGEARGIWYFEADFPVRLYDANDNQITVAVARAQDDWMTEEFVPFTATLSFNKPLTATGTLVLEKNNPSDLPEQSDKLVIPVKFGDQKMESVSLYFYNLAADQKANPDVSCDPKYVQAVQREIPLTETPINDTIKLLLLGRLTDQEKGDGFTSEFPLVGFRLINANLQNGTLTLEFSDPQNRSTGGSCRVGLLYSQIEKTALQFDEVERVEIIPDDLFQP
jgi:hypothetical protein